jgi:hypothetical protein
MMRWEGHVACMGDETCAVFLLENLKVRDHSEVLGIHGKIISEWILGKQDG